MKILHLAVHNGWPEKEEGGTGPNAGDTALNPLIQRLFSKSFNNIFFENRQVWQLVSNKDILDWNQNFDYILIGGGGLFLNDQPGLDQELSGWTWQISLENLKKIKIPFIVFSVGFNKFYGGKDFSNIFWESIFYIYKNSIFFSLRNNGSIFRINEGFMKNNLITDPNKKIYFQPCQSLIYQNIKNEFKETLLEKSYKSPFKISINFAFDRIEQRVKYSNDFLQEQLFLFINNLLMNKDLIGNITLLKHKEIDRLSYKYMHKLLDMHSEKFKVIDVSYFTTEEIYDTYSKFDFALGMRGHGIMIPLGAGVIPYSLISHPKLMYLINDLGIKNIKDVSTDISENIDYQELSKSFEKFLKNKESIINNYKKGLNNFEVITKNNLNILEKIIKLNLC